MHVQGARGLLPQHVLPRYKVSFHCHKDAVLKWQLFLAHDPSMEKCDLGIAII